jgi:hypothetical protein
MVATTEGGHHEEDANCQFQGKEEAVSLNKTVVLRYRFHLEERGLAPGTINVRMAAVRRWHLRLQTPAC